jgi:hypothetical protein
MTGQQLVVYEFGRDYPNARHEVAAGARNRSVWPARELDLANEESSAPSSRSWRR